MLIFEEGKKKYDINYSGISRHADSIAQTIFCHKLLLTDFFFSSVEAFYKDSIPAFFLKE